MTDLQARLQAALGDAYRIEKELGGGGMSRVFLANEASLHRLVVIKLLPPEFASEVSEARFRQEIELAAHLQHPNILPVLTAGARDDLLYYVMPFVSGESLRHRLTREGKLPVADAVRILQEVADALAYAHAEGVIHRDIKPENILLEGSHAVLTDFGVARALVEARSGERLTGTGMSVGTPGYMSPEQAAGERHIDARADVYALAVVGYEMLAGAPPFEGPTPQAVLAAHLTKPPRPLREIRPDVPTAVSAAIGRALAKDPAERLHTAAEFRAAIGAPAAPVAVPRRARLGWAVAGAAMLVAAVAVVWSLRGRGAPEVRIDPNVVAVLPFRVAGADASLGYLREGMVDLLAAKLTGEGGPRSADSRTVLAAWRRAGGSEREDLPQAEAVALARRLGAGRLLLGELVGTPNALALSASLVQVPGGGTRTRASVQGLTDSLPLLIDQLMAQLLLGEAGPAQRFAALASTSLPALQAYLAGQAAYRRGAYREALGHYERAVQLDSTFALAAVGTASAGVWIGEVRRVNRGLALALAARERLSARGRAVLEMKTAQSSYPKTATWADWNAAAERALEVAPDHPDVWFDLGDALFHAGDLMGVPNARDRAAAAFRRAAELDSTFAAPLEHLVELAVLRGDTLEVRRLGALYFAVDSTGELSDFMRWRVATALHDTAALQMLRARFHRMARLREAQGDLRSARTALQRRLYWWSAGAWALATYLREEGRLAALTGDRAGAIKAYQHYLALRSDPEPALQPEVERVRAELAKLVGERGSR